MPGSTRYALDTSFLLYHYYKRDERTVAILEGGFFTPVTLSEAVYMLCRKEGLRPALDYAAKIVKTSTLVPAERVALVAAQLKCKLPVSLADAWALAAGKVQQVPTLFALREKEVVKNLLLITSETPVSFLDEVQ